MWRFARRAKSSEAHAAARSIKRLPEYEYASDPKVDRIVFVCGLHRSGTTLLERLLAARFDVSFLRASVPESEGQHLQTVYRPASDYGGPGKFAFSRQAHEDLLLMTSHETYRAAILSEWREFVVGTSPVLLEKSPPNLTKIWWLRKVFPASQFVIMARDPRAVAGATQKWSRSSLPELVMHWNSAYSRALEDHDESDCVIVRYEDLMEKEDEELNRLGQFLGLRARQVEGGLTKRHAERSNSNEQYVALHEGAKYGAGAWDRFGYSI